MASLPGSAVILATNVTVFPSDGAPAGPNTLPTMPPVALVQALQGPLLEGVVKGSAKIAKMYLGTSVAVGESGRCSENFSKAP